MLSVNSNSQLQETELSCSDFSDIYTIEKLDTLNFERCSSEIFLQYVLSTISGKQTQIKENMQEPCALPNFANPQNIRSTMSVERIFIHCLV